MDRLTPAIERTRAALAAGVRVDDPSIPLDPGAVARLEHSLRNTMLEHVAYQNAQALACASGVISTDEAMIIYTALGEAPGVDGWAAGTDLATKVIVTEVMHSLMAMRLRGRRMAS